MKRPIVLGILGAATLLAIAPAGRAWWTARHPSRPNWEPSAVGKIQQIATNLYVVPGGGGNTAVFVTAKGVLLVDTKYAERYQALVDAVRTVTNKPITHVVNTHCHGDHTGGNALVPADAEIVMHENALLGMGPARGTHPVRTYKDRLTLFDGADAVDLYHFGPAHTDGDTFVVFRAAGVMHAGDVFAQMQATTIDLAGGGSGVAFGETIAKAVAAVAGVDRVISGHGPVYAWSDFVDYGEFNRVLLEHARAAVAAGEDSSKAAAEWTPPPKFRGYKLGKLPLTMESIFKSLRK